MISKNKERKCFKICEKVSNTLKALERQIKMHTRLHLTVGRMASIKITNIMKMWGKRNPYVSSGNVDNSVNTGISIGGFPKKKRKENNNNNKSIALKS